MQNITSYFFVLKLSCMCFFMRLFVHLVAHVESVSAALLHCTSIYCVIIFNLCVSLRLYVKWGSIKMKETVCVTRLVFLLELISLSDQTLSEETHQSCTSVRFHGGAPDVPVLLCDVMWRDVFVENGSVLIRYSIWHSKASGHKWLLKTLFGSFYFQAIMHIWCESLILQNHVFCSLSV